VLLYGTLVLAAPNLLLACALFFSLAAATRSAMAAYLGAAALLVSYGFSSASGNGQAPETVNAILEPFGFGAYRQAVAGWSAAERATRLPELAGPLLWNRVLWLAVAGACLLLAVRAFGRARPDGSRPVATGDDEAQPPSRSRQPRPRPAFDRRTVAAQLAARTRFELDLVLRSPFFAVLLLLGVASAVAALSPWSPGGETFPSGTLAVVARVDESFRLAPVVIAVFYAGELVWGERDHRVHELIGASPLPDSAFLAPKLLCVALALGFTVLASVAAGVAMQLWRGGGEPIDLATWFWRYLLPRSYDLTLVAILAVFLQALSPGKLVGFGWMTFYFVISVSLESAGFNDDLYRYGGHAETLSAMNAGSGRALLVRAYWGALALVLAVAAHQLVGRGGDDRFATRLAQAPVRLRGGAGVLAFAGAAAFGILGLVLAMS
jgi:hypothetical protein